MKMFPFKRVFIIAEAGVNHNGSLNIAKKMIDAAKLSGADAIKFQTFKAQDIVTATAKKAAYQVVNTKDTSSQCDMLKKVELKDSDFRSLADYARKKKIVFLSSPFDRGSVDLLDDIGVAAFKIASGEITNLPLIKYIAQKRKPIILSTGMSNLKEIKIAVDIIKAQGVKNIILLHCVSEYPVRLEDVNLKAIETLRDNFKLPVGFSDHTNGIATAAAAVAVGAIVIEKHFTLSRRMKGPDHKASLEPDEFEVMVSFVRQAEKALGSGVKKATKSEEQIKKYVRKSIVAKINIPEGVKISSAMLDMKRPGTGIPPAYLNSVLGKKTKQMIKKDSLISFKDLK